VIFAAHSHLEVVMAARAAAEMAGQPVHSTLEWVSPETLTVGAAGEDRGAALLRRIRENPSACADPELSREMTWQYDHPEGARTPLKLTASGLLRELEGPEELPVLAERPRFLSEDAGRMTPAERGTACHRAMQLMDLQAIEGLSGDELTRTVAAQVEGFAARRLMTGAQRDAVQPERLSRFLESPMGQRLRRSPQVRREWSFNVRLRLSEALTPEEAQDYDTEATLLVQGTIDCCFVEDDQWVLLDYKTDRTDDMDALRAHYEKQLAVYALALERITGMKVKQRTLCLLESGGTLELGS